MAIGVDGQYRGVDGSKYMYNHGIATIALGELYGQTRNPAMREKLQRAVPPHRHDAERKRSQQGRLALPAAAGDADFPSPCCKSSSARRQETAARRAAADNRRRGGLREAVRRSGRRICVSGGPGGCRLARTRGDLFVASVRHYDDPLMARGQQYLFANENNKQKGFGPTGKLRHARAIHDRRRCLAAGTTR